MEREKVIAQCEWAIRQTSPMIIESKTFYEEVLALLKEQEKLLHKKEKDIDKLCVEISRLKHQIHDNEPTFEDWIKGEGR